MINQSRNVLRMLYVDDLFRKSIYVDDLFMRWVKLDPNSMYVDDRFTEYANYPKTKAKFSITVLMQVKFM